MADFLRDTSLERIFSIFLPLFSHLMVDQNVSNSRADPEKSERGREALATKFHRKEGGIPPRPVSIIG